MYFCFVYEGVHAFFCVFGEAVAYPARNTFILIKRSITSLQTQVVADCFIKKWLAFFKELKFCIDLHIALPPIDLLNVIAVFLVLKTWSETDLSKSIDLKPKITWDCKQDYASQSYLELSVFGQLILNCLDHEILWCKLFHSLKMDIVKVDIKILCRYFLSI